MDFITGTGMEKLFPGAKIAAALSGGIDSRESARRLIQAGYEVTAFYLKLIEEDKNFVKAKQAADSLGIEIVQLDLRQEFKHLIIDEFIRSYLNGLTPNPCAKCNPEIKFGLLLNEVLNRGFDFLASGHYAALFNDSELTRPKDLTKDQTYFLSRLSKEQLKKLIWPMANTIKTELKTNSRLAGFTVPTDSQDICFIDTDYKDFLAKSNVESPAGDIVTIDGKKVGEHQGLIHYTIGQRKGLKIPAAFPYYVISLNVEKNQVIVGSKEDLSKKEFFANNLVLNIEYKVGDSFTADVQIRYHHKACTASIEIISKEKAKISFYDEQSAITPGQIAAIYNGDKCLGGGIISFN